ncbi:type II toxin-antitoxin system VapC family toxin [Iningainema tapete]|uniref:Ribonuclease VapC n=1 Tax=Iningainema tapete BLCC-T55 TaxID=2748662 RepID=A0A8J6XRE5_9CYAN|nr:type II toxin-antitoxin system VapC family toxin [Iningainema tapete]MBD2775192.1 type II toxin-antitoxin system VapC family toxin [Iningainema tapete BLCC-T55]
MKAIYVVDTSVVMQYLLTETYTSHAIVLVQQLQQGAQLCIPEFCLLECANVLWKQVRFQGMSQTEASLLLVELLALPLEIMPVGNLLQRALLIGLDHQLAVYDSFYIALAARLSCPLITVDQRQAQAATASNVVIKPITDFV